MDGVEREYFADFGSERAEHFPCFCHRRVDCILRVSLNADLFSGVVGIAGVREYFYQSQIVGRDFDFGQDLDIECFCVDD